MTFEESIEYAGGFGKFQVFIAFTLIIAFTTGGQIVYGIEFLEIFPEYECFN
jgi:hypothetical protein